MTKVKLNDDWYSLLKLEFDSSYMQNLRNFLLNENKTGKDVLPQNDQWFSALNNTPFDSIKVVILGQDPYPTPGHAHGLCFSVMPHVKPLPKSLININKELLLDVGVDNSHSGYLASWAKQGVLLLNAVLTVPAGQAHGHQGKGWEEFTDRIIEIINQEKENIVFILWGAYAQKKGIYIDEAKHLVIKSAHPSPLSAYRGFFGSKPFSKTNEYLESHGKERINWQLN